MSRRAALGAALELAFLALAVPAAASPYIQAHRGGSLVDGVPTYPENTMSAFRSAAGQGFILEMDAKLTADGVPVIMHDATLDRTTDCTGEVAAKTLAELSNCRVDILGTEGNFVQLAPGDPRQQPIPTVDEALSFARDAGASVSLEIKNVPTDPDFDVGNGFANAVVDAIVASGLPPSRLIVQSFWPLNLDVVESRLPAADTSLLTFNQLNGLPVPITNELGPDFADARGYEWDSPEWPPSPLLVSHAHALGLQVVPYTLDTPAEVTAAYGAAVDAMITDDPTMARRVIASLEPVQPAPPPPPSDAQCAVARASRRVPPVLSFDPRPRAPRVFAIQFKQELRNVTTYRAFRTKVECLIRDYVVPNLASRRPNVVALNEDVGLMTMAIGTRGAAARAAFGTPHPPGCESEGVPCATLAALGLMTVAYSPQVAAYQARFAGAMQPVSSAFVAATDTFARGWMQTFSDLAKRYGIYILGSNDQAPFRESRDPAEIALFADPDLPRPSSVFVATKPAVYNEVFMWGPRDVRQEGPLPLRNVVARNRKVPLTPIEQEIQLTPGPAGGPDAIENIRPYSLPGTGARIGFATSLPAFVYDGDSANSFGRPLAADVDPCSDVTTYYMRCLDRLGANLVIQDEANPGRWAGPAGEGTYQPLEWMRSTWRAAADPSVSFSYNVTPHMVGNLADLAFDGQTAITQRGLSGRGCNYVGDSTFQPGPPESDPERLRLYAGPKAEFLGIAPWVTADGPRSELRATSARLAPGSGDPLENDYVETAVIADLPFPVDRARPTCAQPSTAGHPGAGSP